MRCKHKWELIDKIILPSAYEQMTDKHNLTKVKCEAHNPAYFQKKVVYIFQCANCSKIQKIVEANP